MMEKENLLYNVYIMLKLTYLLLVGVSMLRDMLQAAGFAGNILSLLIVRCIFRMGSPLKLTFLNQMFLVYYGIDAIVGSTEIHFLFKLKEEG